MSSSPQATVLSLAQIQADDSDNVVAGNGSTLMGITGTLMALSFSVVMMRCWARQVILRTFGWDDAAMLLALVGLSYPLLSYLPDMDIEDSSLRSAVDLFKVKVKRRKTRRRLI